MPLTTPQPVDIEVKRADVFRVESFVVSERLVPAVLNPDGSVATPATVLPIVQVQWKGGLKQADGTILWTTEGWATLKEETAKRLGRARPDGTLSFRENIRRSLYKAMMDDGFFPRGTIS